MAGSRDYLLVSDSLSFGHRTFKIEDQADNCNSLGEAYERLKASRKAKGGMIVVSKLTYRSVIAAAEATLSSEGKVIN